MGHHPPPTTRRVSHPSPPVSRAYLVTRPAIACGSTSAFVRSSVRASGPIRAGARPADADEPVDDRHARAAGEPPNAPQSPQNRLGRFEGRGPHPTTGYAPPTRLRRSWGPFPTIRSPVGHQVGHLTPAGQAGHSAGKGRRGRSARVASRPVPPRKRHGTNPNAPG